MQIFVKGVDGRTHTLAGVTDVATVKSHLAEAEGIAEEDQRLIYAGRSLEDGKTLEECGVDCEATLHLSLSLDGGAKKRKKKKVKLAVLKFYKVDSNDKVQRLRKECPHELR